MSAARLTLGPLLYNWPADKMRDFYFRIADEADIDTVLVGEVVCAKRAPFIAPHLPDILDRLAAAGKEVVLSTLALVMSGRDLDMVADAAETPLPIEANDVSAAALVKGRDFLAGPLLNIYNEGTLACLAAMGAMRACLPVELPLPAIAALARTSPIPLEVQVFGRMPLAVSARCYAARANGLSKDSCRYVCADDPDGMEVDSLDGAPFVAVNGTQTLSHSYLDLLGSLRPLGAAGIGHFRLWPQDVDMVAVADLFRRALDGRTDPDEGSRRLAALCPGRDFADGYVQGRAGRAATAAAWDDAAQWFE
jgi:collagenase-like PrtC family protease